jgi:hypothetical protein
LPNAAVLYPLSRKIRGSGAQSCGRVAEYPGNPPANSPTEPTPTVWLFRPVSSAARVGEHSAVTWNRLYRSPASAICV